MLCADERSFLVLTRRLGARVEGLCVLAVTSAHFVVGTPHAYYRGVGSAHRSWIQARRKFVRFVRDEFRVLCEDKVLLRTSP